MKKQQILVLGGGTPKENYDSYYAYLEGLEYNPFPKKVENRKDSLAQNLGEDFELHFVVFPEKNFADYDARKIIFEKTFEYLEDDVILLVTSLGATFISKYLSENKFPFTIKRIIMLAPAFYDTDDVVLGTFHVHDSQYEGFLAQCQEMIIYHSSDDDEVPFSDSENYLKLFPHAEFKKFEKAGHFYGQTRIPELELDIKR